MEFRHDLAEASFDEWLASSPDEDRLREAYLLLETKHVDLWTPGHIDSYRSNRYDLDSLYVQRLVRIRHALVDRWQTTGRLSANARDPTLELTLKAFAIHVGKATSPR